MLSCDAGGGHNIARLAGEQEERDDEEAAVWDTLITDDLMTGHGGQGQGYGIHSADSIFKRHAAAVAKQRRSKHKLEEA